jgi:hypothetical protein
MLRVLRLFKQLKQLRMLISGFIGSLSAVGWIMVLIGIILFIFAIFCTNMVGNNSELWGDEAEEIKELWGSVAKSSFSLFQIMTLDDWATLKNQVNVQLPFMNFFWILFVVLNAFVILSLLTGVMADHMNKVREMEEAEDAKLSDVEVKALLKNIAKNFCKLNDDGDPIMYLDGFEAMVDDRDFQRQLKGIDPKLSIEGSEVRDIFHILDVHFNGFLTLHDLEDGIASLNDPITTKVIMEFHRSVHSAKASIAKTGKLPERTSEAPSAKALAKLTMAEEGMDNLEKNVHICADRIREIIKAVDRAHLKNLVPVSDDEGSEEEKSHGSRARN